jgi:hypothetical protein
MSRAIIVTGLCLLSAVNIAVLIINMSSPSNGEPSKAPPSKGAPSKGAAAGMKYLRDPDFTRAVKEIIQECTVNVDLAKVEC